jgi:hypothetical protein
MFVSVTAAQSVKSFVGPYWAVVVSLAAVKASEVKSEVPLLWREMSAGRRLLDLPTLLLVILFMIKAYG